MQRAPAWFKCLSRPAEEFASTPLTLRSGSIPSGLRGTLYRNGAARLERGGRHVGHWFDGDGAVLAVHFADGGATGTYRYVHSRYYEQEERAGQFLFGNYGMTAPGPVWNHWRRPLKNAANTSVLALSDRLLALWEGGQPHALDLDSLQTRGLDDLPGPAGRLPGGAPYSAHPKRDPETGDIYNFGVAIGGPNATLKLYRCDRHGRLQARADYPLEGVPFIHDFAMAGPYLVFAVPPVRISALPVLLGARSYSDSIRWRPELGSGILIFHRDTLGLAARGEAEPWFQWHFGNGAVRDERDGTLVLDFVRYSDFSTNEYLREIPSGRTVTRAPASLWRLALDPRSAAVRELVQVSDRSAEFPVVAAGDAGRPWRYTYMSVHRPGSEPPAEYHDGLARLDHHTGTLAEADLGGGRYVSEPILAADRDAQGASAHPGSDGDGSRHWLLSVVYDSDADASEVWVFDAARLAEGPACVLGLPSVVPLSFHGNWRPS